MRCLDEFHDPKIAQGLIKAIEGLVDNRQICLMEVCGTHTTAIFKHGLRGLLPASLKLLSGPGCPVCVTPAHDIDAAIWLSSQKDVIFTTFGDMMRVPGTTGSLEKQRAKGADIRVVYSVLDALNLAKTNPAKKVVFLGVGFETTSPGIASGMDMANYEGISNFWVYSCHKLIPPAMKALLGSGEVKIDGFICPGHVSIIIGAKPYGFIAEQYHVPCVITGFEPVDILQAILMLVKARDQARVEIQYTRAVKIEGNVMAQQILANVFEPVDAAWRGIGVIPVSGLKIRQEYSRFDASIAFEVPQDISCVETAPSACICGKILRGVATPIDCPLFATVCTPEEPIGACMVSSEGTCSAYYKYRGIIPLLYK